MIDYKEELKYNRQERDRIKSEINDLESRIFVERGRHNRFEANNYRERVNRLKMRLNEISLKIVELEKMVNRTNGQVQAIPDAGLIVPYIKDGQITITDEMEFDRGFSGIEGDVIQTVERTIERTIKFRNNKPVSCIENVHETIKTQKLGSRSGIFIESSVVD